MNIYRQGGEVSFRGKGTDFTRATYHSEGSGRSCGMNIRSRKRNILAVIHDGVATAGEKDARERPADSR